MPPVIEQKFIIFVAAACLLIGCCQPAACAYTNRSLDFILAQAPPGYYPPAPAVNPKRRFQALLRQIQHVIASGRPQEATVLVQQGISMRPRNIEIYFWKGLALDEAGKTKEAMRAYVYCLRLAITTRMDSSELRINLGNTLLKLGFVKEAIFDYERAVEIEPTSGTGYHYLGRGRLRLKQYQEAMDQFRKCEELGYHHPSLPYLKCLALAGLRQYPDAINELHPLLTPEASTANPTLYEKARALFEVLSSP